VLGVSLNLFFQSLFQKYPGVDLNKSAADPVGLLLKNILFRVSYISVFLGGLGTITAIGLLRMRRWARLSVIVWCIVSTLACLFGLVYPGPRSEFPINHTPILALMLFVFPINAWWLLLFFRPAIKSQFGRLATSPEVNWRLRTKELLMPKWIMLAAGGILLAAGLGWAYWRNSPMREIERSRAAVAANNTWHYHRVRLNLGPGIPPDSFDVDTTCPSFQHTIQSGTGYDGAPSTSDSINYFGRVYKHVGDQWELVSGSQGSVPIFECMKKVSIGNDENSLPFDGIIEDGTVQRGTIGEVAGDSCRNYEISVPTPHDPEEKEFRFTMCISEHDHLPRETRRTPPRSTQEGVSTYTQWNNLDKPQLPPDFHE
jgi:predicted membrane channel-forming protein YqfA (hemolysin III family)